MHAIIKGFKYRFLLFISSLLPISVQIAIVNLLRTDFVHPLNNNIVIQTCEISLNKLITYTDIYYHSYGI